MKKFIVTAVDYGDTCDGKAEILGVFKTKKEAKKYVSEDMQSYYNNNKTSSTKMSKRLMSVKTGEYDAGCEWNIHEVELDE